MKVSSPHTPRNNSRLSSSHKLVLPLPIWRQTNKLRFHCPLRFVSKYNLVEHETVLLQATSQLNKMFNILEFCFVYLKSSNPIRRCVD
jgi:hypothetical protein